MKISVQKRHSIVSTHNLFKNFASKEELPANYLSNPSKRYKDEKIQRSEIDLSFSNSKNFF
jgi:hypothetical protein